MGLLILAIDMIWLVMWPQTILMALGVSIFAAFLCWLKGWGLT